MEQRLYFIKDIHVQFAWARLFSLAYRVAQFRLALIEIDYITRRLSGRILIRVTYKISWGQFGIEHTKEEIGESKNAQVFWKNVITYLYNNKKNFLKSKQNKISVKGRVFEPWLSSGLSFSSRLFELNLFFFFVL